MDLGPGHALDVSPKSNSISPDEQLGLLDDLNKHVRIWSQRLKSAVQLAAEKPNPSNELYKNYSSAVKDIQNLRTEIQNYGETSKITASQVELESSSIASPTSIYGTFLIKFALIHVYSCLAKWQESCEELKFAEDEHKLCISLIEQILKSGENIEQNCVNSNIKEINIILVRCRYMLLYELTRYAILSSDREKQDEALELLKRAEEFYHAEVGAQAKIKVRKDSAVGMLDSLNSETASDMFTYILFYLGQAYRILGEKEKSVLYLHMVLRKQLEKGDYSPVSWSGDTTKMASVVIINMQSFDTARCILLAAQVVLNKTLEEEKSKDAFKESWADLGRCWVKLGVDLLETSSDRLKDLAEQTKKLPKFSDKTTLSDCEKLSLGINSADKEFDTLLLIQSLEFPTLDLKEVQQTEMKGRFVRDFDEARSVFLPLQKWVKIAKEYYVLDEYAGDYIDIMTDYSHAFKHLAFFEPDLERQIKMQRRRIMILEELLTGLNPKAYYDVFHICLRDLAEIYEKVYKLKVTLIKERGESLKPRDKKLVKILFDAIGAHRKNLMAFEFDLQNPSKDLQEEYQKSLMGNVLSIARLLGGISHDHPHHESAVSCAEDAKLYYTYFLEYLDRRPKLKEDFKVLYDGSRELPELLDNQIERIKHRLRTMNI